MRVVPIGHHQNFFIKKHLFSFGYKVIVAKQQLFLRINYIQVWYMSSLLTIEVSHKN